MYREMEDEELHPDDYFLATVGSHQTEDECFDFMSEPRQTQTTIGMFLKKNKNAEKRIGCEETARFQKRLVSFLRTVAVDLVSTGAAHFAEDGRNLDVDSVLLHLQRIRRKDLTAVRGVQKACRTKVIESDKVFDALMPALYQVYKVLDSYFINDRHPGASERPDAKQRDPHLEKFLVENKGFWIDKPTLIAPLVHKLKNLYSVDIPRKDTRSRGIFYRPDYLELDYLIKLGEAGLLYDEEETVDSEEDVKPDDTMCVPLRKKKYRICDPCKPTGEKSKKFDDTIKTGNEQVLSYKKIPTGCQCNYYGGHNEKLEVWDCPFQNEVDMVRKHEMNKYLKYYKSELLNENYKRNPPVHFKPTASESKRTFPDLMLSNL